MRVNKHKNIILVTILVVMFIPLFQNIFNIFPERDLKGVAEAVAFPAFSASGWNDGEFQSEFDKAINENIGFRNLFIRIKNQVDYSLFSKSNASGVIVGKKRTLYEWDYIRAYIGRDFIGKEAIDKKMSRTFYLQNELKKKGVDLIVVFEPGKASFQPENIPDKFRPVERGLTNYDYMRLCADSLNVKYLDLNQYFIQIKDTVKYPLIPKCGIHWSVYGMNLAVDTLIKYIEDKRGIDMPDKKYYRIDETRIPRNTDNDLVRIMNLLKDPKPEILAYPVTEYIDGPEKTRPKVYCVGDSFYLNLVSARIPQKIFSSLDFMYYFTGTRYTENVESRGTLLEHVESQDVILIMITERFFYMYAWGFIDELYQYLSGNFDEYLGRYYYENRIRQDFKWFDRIVIEASDRGINLADHIRDHAGYMVVADIQNNAKLPDVKYYINEIRKDSVWLESVKQKAIEKNISLDSMIRLDAEWLLKNSGPAK